MNEQSCLQILKNVGAVIMDTHVVLTSGLHGSAYVNKDALYAHTKETALLCASIADQFSRHGDVEVVIAPAVGGVILSQWTAYYLTVLGDREVLGVYAEKEVVKIPDPDAKGRQCFAETDNFVIKRGYGKLITGKNVLAVEDVLTTGGSAIKVIEAARVVGGNVIGLCVICNRGGITPQDVGNIPHLTALVNLKLDTWEEADCPLCAKGMPINAEVGKGREFLARKQSRE